MASPSLRLFKLIILQQSVNKRVIQSLAYHYTEFVIQIRPTNHDNWKICDRLGHYLHQGDPLLASPMSFSSFHFLLLRLDILDFS